MSIDNEHVLNLAGEINEITRSLTREGTGLANSRREALIIRVEQLAIALRKPEEHLYYQATQTAQNSAIRIAIGMRVFEHVPLSESGISAKDLAKVLRVEELLLIRVMRACVSTHLFQETSSGHYVHNALSITFLTPSNRDMFQQMYDFVGRAVYSMPYFLESTNYRNPTDYHDGAFQYGHLTDLGFFEYLMDNPERIRLFNSGMRSATTVGIGATSLGPYPFEAELTREGIKDAEVLIVDVGGGRGQALEVFKAAFPDLKGRMVLHDLPDVVKNARAMGLPRYVEVVASSFFETQPIQGAYVYYFRRIFHDWSDEASLTILRHTCQAMEAHSRLLIVDTVVPERGASRHIALQDINMMSFGGMERTRAQWEHLLAKAGLRAKRFWTADASLQQAIEAVVI